MTTPYRLTGKQLGEGNFSTGVHLAEHQDLGRKVAIKLLEVDFLTDRESLLDEARKMVAIDEHVHVVKVLDAGDWDSDTVFIASEVCPGGSLEDVLRNGPLDPSQACRLVSDACRGLDHLHRHGLLHLDVRPANLLLGSDGRVKLVDFGLARWIKAPDVEQFYAPHAAPEVIRSWSGSEASDQYSTAMTLAHLITAGEACADPPASHELDAALACGSWPKLDAFGLNVPRRLRRVIKRGVAPDPSGRYQSIEDFKRALDRATPSVSFLKEPGGDLVSSDQEWTIGTITTRNGLRVETRRRGRRVGRLGAESLSTRQATKHVETVVSSLAYPS